MLIINQQCEKIVRAPCGFRILDAREREIADIWAIDGVSEAEAARRAVLYLRAQGTLDALKVAERFMSGFEGDEPQEGIDEQLAAIRSAIANCEVDDDVLSVRRAAPEVAHGRSARQ